MAAVSNAETMKFKLPEGELRSDIVAGLKQGVLLAAGALVLTLPPSGLATLRSAPPNVAAAAAPVAPIDRTAPFRAADFGNQPASADVRFVADWVADSGDSGGLPWIVLDKRDARVYVFRADGTLIASSPVLLGATPGDDSAPDIGTRPISLVKQEEKTTPAGRFVAEPGKNTAGEDVVWVDYDAAVSMHRVRMVDPKERRFERLRSPNPADRRISYGCINLPVPFFETVVWPLLQSSRAVAYVLPETRGVGEVFAGAYDAAMKSARAQSAVARDVKISRQNSRP